MSIRKDLKIKSLKRVHVFPHIVLLLLFSGFFTIVFALIQAGVLLMTVDNKIIPYDLSAIEFKNSVEEYLSANGGTISANALLPETEGSVIISTSENAIVYRNTEESLPVNAFKFYSPASKHPILFDNVVSNTDVFNAFTYVDATQLLTNYITQYHDRGTILNFDSDSLQENAFQFPGWLELRLAGGNYSLFYKADINITHMDMNYIMLSCIISVVLVAIPMILYITTLIISLVGQARASRIIYLDTTTGGKNWNYFVSHGETALKRARRKAARNYVMISLRMDKYQNYCMCYGAKEGEELIERFANIMQKQKLIRNREFFARYSEAEFGFLFLHNSSMETDLRIETIKNYLLSCAKGRKIEFSAGICEAGQEIKVATLYSNASIARKAISPDASKRIAWYNEELRSSQMWEHYVEDHMENALKNGEFKVYIQPKYKADTKTLGGGEALIRWVSPEHGIISPIKFIPIFEKNGFITKIDDFMIKSLATYQAKWIAEGRDVVPISVNVSRAHFTRPDLAEHICNLVESTGAPKEVIELELTESAFFQDRDVLITTVQKLRDYGFKVSMDDFGADYSSLNSLKDMPLDVIKLDAGFFRGKEENEARGSVIVAGIIDLAKHLDMHIVAEGIEYKEQVDFLAEHGCDLIQGFYFAKPMPVEEYEMLES